MWEHGQLGDNFAPPLGKKRKTTLDDGENLD
jgi:hypothetical protein